MRKPIVALIGKCISLLMKRVAVRFAELVDQNYASVILCPTFTSLGLWKMR